jgi:hypothetical protein
MAPNNVPRLMGLPAGVLNQVVCWALDLAEAECDTILPALSLTCCRLADAAFVMFYEHRAALTATNVDALARHAEARPDRAARAMSLYLRTADASSSRELLSLCWFTNIRILQLQGWLTRKQLQSLPQRTDLFPHLEQCKCLIRMDRRILESLQPEQVTSTNTPLSFFLTIEYLLGNRLRGANTASRGRTK